LKICIIRLSAIGDIVHSLTTLQFLKANLKNIQIDWLVEERFKDLLNGVSEIDNILSINLKGIKKKKSLIFTQIKLLKKYSLNQYDYIIDAQGLFKSALSAKFLKSYKSKIIGFDKNSIREKIASFFYDIKISSPYEKNVILRNFDVICKPFNINISKEKIINKKPIFKVSNFDIKINFEIIFIIGASLANKTYPKEKFLKLAKLFDKKIGVVWGNEAEKKDALFLEKNAKNVIVLPKLNFDELKFILNKAKLVIGGDTGPTHIAWGLNKATITIFGNTPHLRNTLITPKNLVIKSNSTVNPLKLDKFDFSINEISELEIFKLAKRLLDE